MAKIQVGTVPPEKKNGYWRMTRITYLSLVDFLIKLVRA